jgi:hypothetical protein
VVSGGSLKIYHKAAGEPMNKGKKGDKALFLWKKVAFFRKAVRKQGRFLLRIV